jgi:hypothetical protein
MTKWMEVNTHKQRFSDRRTGLLLLLFVLLLDAVSPQSHFNHRFHHISHTPLLYFSMSILDHIIIVIVFCCLLKFHKFYSLTTLLQWIPAGLYTFIWYFPETWTKLVKPRDSIAAFSKLAGLLRLLVSLLLGRFFKTF